MKEVVDCGKVEALKSVRPRTEPPYAERHVRWCERGRQTPPTRLLSYKPENVTFIVIRHVAYVIQIQVSYIIVPAGITQLL